MGYSLGVDLGTTFTAAAISQGRSPEVVTLGDRSVVMPSVVYLGEDGAVVTGEAASRREMSSPDRVSRGFKRRLGDPTPVMLGGRPHKATELLAAVLSDVLARVSQTEGAPPQRVVLTHPANWGPYRRGLFDDVPTLSGLSDTVVITEPEAAAAYYAATRRLGDDQLVAVYDLGGGTFDVTVLRKRPDGIEILGVPEGIERLGGIDFDDAILRYVNHASGETLTELDPRDPSVMTALARLRQDCVLAKEALSADTETIVPVFLPGRHFDVPLTRTVFEGLVRAQIESTIGALSRTLRSAHITPDQLSAVLLVGGSSRIPLVAQMVSEELDRPIVVDTHPKYAVALGAATRAAKSTTSGAGIHVAPQLVLGGAPTASAKPAPPGPTSAPPSSGPPPQPEPEPEPESDPEPEPEPDPEPHDVPTTTSSVPTASPPAEATAGTPVRPHRRPAALLWASVVAGAIGIAAIIVFTHTWRSPLNPPTTSTIPLESPPDAVAITPDGAHAYISTAGLARGGVVVLDTTRKRNPTSAVIPMSTDTTAVAVAPDGRHAYTTSTKSNTVSVIDTTTNSVTATIPLARAHAVAVTPDSRRAYITDNASPGTVSVVDTTTNTVTATITVGQHPRGVAISPNGRYAYVTNSGIPDYPGNSVSVIDTTTDAVTNTILVGASPTGVAITADGRHAYITNTRSDTVSVIDTTTNTVTATITVGQAPEAVAITPDGRHAYTTNTRSDTVSVIDTTTDAVTNTILVGASPTGVAITADGRHAYITNTKSNTVSVIGTANN